MSLHFEELAYHPTPLGELVLRRRRIPGLSDSDVFEVKLGDEFLMSSLFNAGEIALADLGLAEVKEAPIDVLIGGLGLGYTAWATLNHAPVRSILVIEALGEVIEWHQDGLVPLGETLTADPRCQFSCGDFFALAQNPQRGFDPKMPARRFHAILLDIDHSPRHLLNPEHVSFYEIAGLRQLATFLNPGGIFALWSNDPPDEDFLADLGAVFSSTRAHVVKFPNPLQQKEAANTIYVARKSAA